MEFKTWRTFLKYIKDQESDESIYGGAVLLPTFNIQEEYELLDKDNILLDDIITYVVVSNPVLWAQYWLRNPQNPSEPMRLFRYQKSILNCQNDYKLTRCGRQIGKTVCMCIDMLWNAWAIPNNTILYVAPYQNQVNVAWEKTIMPMIYDVPEVKNSIVKILAHPHYTARFKDGSIIEALTAGTKSGQKGAGIRGTNANRLYMDEIDYMGDTAIEAVAAITASRPEAKVWVSSTPTGKRESFYRWATDKNSMFRCKECEKLHLDGTPFHYPSHVSPLFNEKSDNFFKSTMSSSAYSHEILADWGEEVEGVFRHVDIDVCLAMGRHSVTDIDTQETEDISYNYFDLKPDNRNMYILGIDWNKESTGVQLCIVEYNKSNEAINSVPPHYFRLFRTEIITAKEFSEAGTVSRTIQLDQEIHLSYIYADAGYGSIQVEAIKQAALNMNNKELAGKIISVNLSSPQEVYDPLTRQKTKKPMKPFMVEVASRIVESRRIILPDCEDEKTKLVGQMREYYIIRRGVTGQPIYSRDNEDMLMAWMFALLGFMQEFSDLINIPSINYVSSLDNSINSRASKVIPARWVGKAKKTLQDYGVKQASPVFSELAQLFNLPYSYTTDSRSEDIRPPTKTNTRGYTELRGETDNSKMLRGSVSRRSVPRRQF